MRCLIRDLLGIDGSNRGRRRDLRSSIRMGALRIAGTMTLLFGTLVPRVEAQSVVSMSPDVTIPLGSGNLVVRDDAVATDNQLGIVLLQSLGILPESADVIGYAEIQGGSKLLIFDTTVSLPGGTVARPGDVVAWNGSVYSIVFDASVAGLPQGAQTDAVSISTTGGLILSFDTDASLPGAITAADEDLVRWNGASGFTLALDGSLAGLDRSLDIDAVDDLTGSTFLVSFDTGGRIGTVSFSDEDVLRYAGGTWTVEIDASSSDSDWGASDLDALQVPEPGRISVLRLGLLGLLGAHAMRRGIGPSFSSRRSVRGNRLG